MTKAILYVFHGSRLKEAKEEAFTFFRHCQKLTQVPIQHASFLELSEPTIEQGVEECVNEGATEIAVIPILLFRAGHAKYDIPSILTKLKEKYPETSFSYGEPLGVHQWMIDIVVEKVRSVTTAQKLSEISPQIVLIGRGSKDREMQQDFNTLCQSVENQLGMNTTGCYLTAAKPSFHEILSTIKGKEANQLYIFVPYLIFTGLLYKQIERDLKIELSNRIQWQLTDYIGQHPNIHRLVSIRAQEALSRYV